MIKINFVTHLPMKQGSPCITNISNKPLSITLKDNDNKVEPIIIELEPKQTYTSPYQYYVNWKIQVWAEDPNLSGLIPGAKTPIWEYDLDLENQVVFIKMDAYALGDNLAWMPYVEKFQQKHNCKIICSTFWNNLFSEVYPNIMFVAPNTRIENVFAQYYIGTHDDTPPMYSPTTYLTEPLRKVAADILGLKYDPLDEAARVIQYAGIKREPKKVCLSEHASLDMKTWHGDWQAIVDLLVENGYEVHVISKEPTKLKNVIDDSGDHNISYRIMALQSASYFIGVSSGLSWLAHSLGCHVFLISDFTPPNHEFYANTTRIFGNGFRTEIKYEPVEQEVSTEHVIKSIKSKLQIK